MINNVLPEEDKARPNSHEWKEMSEERMNNDKDPSVHAPSSKVMEDSPATPKWEEMKEERMNNDKQPE